MGSTLNNYRCINIDRTTALEWAAAFYWRQIVALHSVIVITRIGKLACTVMQ